MAIKVIETPVPEKATYPVVCRHREYDTLIVLFTSRDEGVCLSPENHPPYGQHTEDWDERKDMWIPTCVTINSIGVM